MVLFFSNQILNNLVHHFKYIILDEVFHSSFSQNNELNSKIFFPNLIKINSLSKSIGLSMIRFGWITASPELIEEIRKISLLTFTDYPTPSLRIAKNIFQNIQDILLDIKSNYSLNKKMIKQFIAQHPSLKFSHNFDTGNFGAIEDTRDLSKFCLSSNLFGENNLWRFRIDLQLTLLEELMLFFR